VALTRPRGGSLVSAQRTDDGIAAVQSAHEGRLVAHFALDQLCSRQVGARFRTNQRRYGVTTLLGGAVAFTTNPPSRQT
jgi:hypothetical protein